MNNNNLSEVMQSLFKGMDTVLSTKTVVGEPTQIGDVIILPLVDVSFGVAAGASLGDSKNNGGGGLGGKMSPNAVLVIKDGTTKLVNIKNLTIFGNAVLLKENRAFVFKFYEKCGQGKNRACNNKTYQRKENIKKTLDCRLFDGDTAVVTQQNGGVKDLDRVCGADYYLCA